MPAAGKRRQPNAARSDDILPEGRNGIRQNHLLARPNTNISAPSCAFCRVQRPCVWCRTSAISRYFTIGPTISCGYIRTYTAKTTGLRSAFYLAGIHIRSITDELKRIIADAQRAKHPKTQLGKPGGSDNVERVQQKFVFADQRRCRQHTMAAIARFFRLPPRRAGGQAEAPPHS